MKIRWDICQGTEPWAEARRGIPTASEFDALISPLGVPRKSEGRQTYILRKLAEAIVGYSAVEGDKGQSFFMQQGLLAERYARPWFEYHTGTLVEVPGLCINDDGTAACSPDGLIKGQEVGLEMKCPDTHTHLAYLLDGGVPKDYLAQVQGSMYVTGYQWWFFVSWHAKLPPLCIKVARDEAFCANLKVALDGFHKDFAAGKEKLNAILNPPKVAAA